MKKLKFLFFLILFLFNINVKADEAFFNSFNLSSIKPNYNIYFDASDVNWENVYIHIWGVNGDYKSWTDSDELIKVKDNIYKFTMPNDTLFEYEMLLFKNKMTGSRLQTKDLGFIQNNFAFKASNTLENGKVTGYWYLYDKSEIISYINRVKKYQEDKLFYVSSTYSNLDELINTASNESENEIKIEAERDKSNNHTGKYYYSITPTLKMIDEIIKNLKVDRSILRNKINDVENKFNEYENLYTKSSVDNLKNVIYGAKVILNNENITVDELKEELNKINNALNCLVLASNPKAYDNIIKSVALLIISILILFIYVFKDRIIKK